MDVRLFECRISYNLGLEGVFQRECQTIRMGGDEIQELCFRAELTDRRIVELAVLHHTILSVVDVRDSTDNDGTRLGSSDSL